MAMTRRHLFQLAAAAVAPVVPVVACVHCGSPIFLTAEVLRPHYFASLFSLRCEACGWLTEVHEEQTRSRQVCEVA